MGEGLSSPREGSSVPERGAATTVPLYGKKAAGRVALVDDADYDLVMQYRWYVWERTRSNGSIDGPYAITRSAICGGRRQNLKMHRLLMPGALQVDHKNGDGLDCQRSNLRVASDSQNRGNERKRHSYNGRRTSSRFKGVYWGKRERKWVAQIGVNGRHRGLGSFADETAAARAYDAAALEAWGEFACVNFPSPPRT